jgi:hypothetical protein
VAGVFSLEKAKTTLMKKRPLAVTVISWVYIGVGLLGLAAHLMDFKIQHPFQYDIVWIALVHVIAVVAGVYMLLGSNWARWLAIVWLAFHVVVSGFDSLSKLAIHVVFLAVFAYFLLRNDAKEYFRAPRRPELA